MQIKSKIEAQARVDQINQFQKELKILEESKIITLDEEQNEAIRKYHKNLTSILASNFDVDANNRGKQLSWGMKIASFLGALGLSASIFFLFMQFWGDLKTITQVSVLISAPISALLITMYISTKEKSSYFTKIFSLITFVCFVLNISMLGQIFNITPSPNAFLIWALFASLLAYAMNARLLLAFAIMSFSAYLSAKIGTWSGMYWISFGERPEVFLPTSIVIFLISFINHYRYSGFDVIYRVFAMLTFFIPTLILSNWGGISYLELPQDTIEAIYQTSGFIISALAIWLGIKKNLVEVVNTANVFFVIFLYTKFHDWFWDWMPKYIFFFIIGISAIFLLFIFKNIRNSMINNKKEV